MYADVLELIVQQMAKLEMSPPRPATADEIANLRDEAARVLGHPIPEHYVGFLGKANGLCWNGLTIFSAQRSEMAGHADAFIEGFVEANTRYRLDYGGMEEFDIFAEDSVVFFAFNRAMGAFRVVSLAAQNVYRSYDTFDELMADALRAHV